MRTQIEPTRSERGISIGTGHYSFERKLWIVNPVERAWTKSRFILWFGACGPTYLLVYANSLDDALDECVDWLVDHAPGQLADEQVHDEYNRLIAEGKSEEEAMEGAAVDTTCAGNCGNYLNSWEWGIAAENPTRAQLVEFIGAKS